MKWNGAKHKCIEFITIHHLIHIHIHIQTRNEHMRPPTCSLAHFNRHQFWFDDLSHFRHCQSRESCHILCINSHGYLVFCDCLRTILTIYWTLRCKGLQKTPENRLFNASFIGQMCIWVRRNRKCRYNFAAQISNQMILNENLKSKCRIFRLNNVFYTNIIFRLNAHSASLLSMKNGVNYFFDHI